MKNKKGNMGAIQGIVLTIVVLVVLFVLGFKIVDVLQSTTTTNSAAYNATVDLQGSSGLGLVLDLVPVAIIVLIFAGILAYFKYFR